MRAFGARNIVRQGSRLRTTDGRRTDECSFKRPPPRRTVRCHAEERPDRPSPPPELDIANQTVDIESDDDDEACFEAMDQAREDGTMDLPDECVTGSSGVSKRNLRKAVSAASDAAEEAVRCVTEETPQEVRALVDVVKQQASLMARHQQQLDAMNARMTQNQRILSRLAESTPGFSEMVQSGGFSGAFTASPSLSDEAVRQRLQPGQAPASRDSAAAGAADAATAPPLSPQFGPLIPNLNRANTAAPLSNSQAAWLSGDRRRLGGFDARFHSANPGATPSDHRVLPERIILVRHAQSEGNIDNVAYTYIPDPQIPLTAEGRRQAAEAGRGLNDIVAERGDAHKLFFYTSPYRRSIETYTAMAHTLPAQRIVGVQEEVQLREQDFGNFQDAVGKAQEKSERLKFGRFFYRFPNGESGADVYDRITIFEDHMVRDINAGRFSSNTSLVLLTHGLSLRIFLMRWFHWSVDDFLNVFNPPNCQPLVLERVCEKDMAAGGFSWIHTKSLYQLTPESRALLKGVTPSMCSTSERPNGISAPPRRAAAGVSVSEEPDQSA